MSIGRITYVLFPTVREADAPRRLAQGAAVAIEARLGHPVHAAVSSAKTGAQSLPALRREADEVMEVLTTRDDSPAVASVADLQGALLLRRLGAQFRNNPQWRQPGVTALLEHDAVKGTDYGVSLSTYFAAMGDITAAAAALNVHPNTLRYRIRRAQSLFDLHLDDADDRLAVWLQLRLAGQD
ncbi:PucR family transcriptional regulator [Specibacter cremeus]|uniref:PucR family transcriptional regulator n=1 Tax=Specibacter cremeus TaxID=1629051 RepID=UPI000F7AD2E2|nr:helix-turn-helix domain-containing protein [Specibacter cremeus]